MNAPTREPALLPTINSIRFRTRGTLVQVAVLLACVSFGTPLYGQAGLRESLDKLDTNKNGVIEPTEITPLARPYFEQLSRSGSSSTRLSLERPNEITKIQESARRYHALRNGKTSRSRVTVKRETPLTVKPFGLTQADAQVPEFGLSEMKFAYTKDDLDFADRTLRTHDENKDGFIDRDEADRHEWTHRNPFADDLNHDDRLSRMEMTQRYARRRLLDQSQGEQRKKDWREKTGIHATTGDQSERRDSSIWWRRGGSDYWLTASLMGRFDRNKNGKLEADETERMSIPVSTIDTDRDRELSRDELFAYLKGVQDAAGGSAESPPDWFVEMDTNGDGQIEMREYASEWTDEKLEKFSTIDVNLDGLITAREVVGSQIADGEIYANNEAELLPPRKTIISEIEVGDQFVIGDLNVQISITHSNDADLDAYLTGPDGQRVELFTAVGGSGNHFDKTIFDDEATESIAKGRPPFSGTYAPEGVLSKQPGLNLFKGSNINGVWQLVIRGTRSERFGILHTWSLIAKPQSADDAPADPAAAF